MKNTIIAILFLMTGYSFAQNDYFLQVNDSILEVALDKEYKININGKEVNFKVSVKDILLYDDDLFSFQYSKDYKITKTKIDEGIEQIMIMTAEGSGIMIQKYSSFNPTMLNEMMLNEITKESISYGYKLNREDYVRSLKSGKKIEVDKAVLTYKGEKNVYEISSIGNKDEGIMIMTMDMIMDNKVNEQGQKLINLMWDSLNYK
ncbi:hypothetical protein L3X39_02230 [Sabulilitoribacter multivorans]|uniref:Uncharacterized protein n=1 Tax=Flaviramulus multivorans TaxID=1304750 RepID=A0ABS9IFB6_9FLAO|nr:hypothetical protein [Flaviramulus multivorans]MCF7559439.1 hypothetical protein [Flaviramulus multivorans]